MELVSFPGSSSYHITTASFPDSTPQLHPYHLILRLHLPSYYHTITCRLYADTHTLDANMIAETIAVKDDKSYTDKQENSVVSYTGGPMCLPVSIQKATSKSDAGIQSVIKALRRSNTQSKHIF